MSEYISGVYIGQYKVLLELYLGSVSWPSDSVYVCIRSEHACSSGRMALGRGCVREHVCA